MLRESKPHQTRGGLRERGAKDRTSVTVDAEVKTDPLGTSDMPARCAGRSGVTVADQPTPSENALVCQEPQLDRYLSAAKRAYGKVKNLDPNEFCERKLARVLSRIDELRRLAEHTPGHLGGLDLHELLCTPEYLLYAYQSTRVRSAPGLDGIADRGVTLAGLLKLGSDLRDGSYRPNPTKRIMIPKAKPGEFRPLGIPSTRDKIVQNGVRLLLEALFEPTFEDESYGFRPGRGCHTALKHIEIMWPDTTWLLEFDFRKAFDTVNHRVLMGQLSSRYTDRRFSQVIWRFLKVGYVNPHNLVDSKLVMDIGTPQGSIISPILCNITLDKLDKFVVHELMPAYNVPARGRRISEAYLDHVGRWVNNPWADVRSAVRRVAPNLPNSTVIKTLTPVRVENAKVAHVPYYEKSDVRLTYVRYADDFLLGLRGPKPIAKELVQRLAAFIESGSLAMQINPEKSGIRHISDGVTFLGYRLFLQQTHRQFGVGEQRAKHTRMMFGVPVERLLARYADRGFFQKARKGTRDKYVARHQSKFVALPPHLVVARYNSVVRGLVNYYRGSERASVMSELLHMLRRSAALTLAHQQKKGSASYAYARWGKALTVTTTNSKHQPFSVSFAMPSLAKDQRAWMGGDVNELTRRALVGFAYPKTMTLVQRASDLTCAIPGCGNTAAQWHHVKHRRRIGGGDWGHSQVVSAARQLPVCKSHHAAIHGGVYDGPSLKRLPGYD